MKIVDNDGVKILLSENYNYVFNKRNGRFARWGRTTDDDPDSGLAEIADIEISTICHGVGTACDFCYKANTPQGGNMSLETYKQLLDKIKAPLTQVALGLGSIDANPDLWKIMEYTRECGVVPNITINGARMTKEYYDKLAKLCGAVSVSLYDEDTTFNAVKELTDRGMEQVNLHVLVAEETYDRIKDLFKRVKTDERLKKLNAIVLLSLKKKGRGVRYSRISDDKFVDLVRYAMKHNIKMGFDSCTCPKWLKCVKDDVNYQMFYEMSEPCESACFSSYFNYKAEFFPCSFMEGEKMDDGQDWTTGINVLDCGDFVRDIWNSEKVKVWRERLINNKDELGCRNCPHYEI